MPLHIGVIGAGRMGAIHARHLAGSIANARLVAIADIHQERADALAAELDVEAYYDFGSMLASAAVEAVVIAGPTDQREDMLTAAFETGKPIFCEKPLSLSLPHLTRIKEAADASDAFVQLGFMRRFDPGYAAARRFIDEGRIGQVIGVHSMTRDPYIAHRAYIAASGGIFADQAVHDFDIARFLMKDEVASVYAAGGVYKYDWVKEFDDWDNTVATLRFEGGGIGTTHGSRNAIYGYDVRAEVYGTEGSIRIGYEKETALLLLTEKGAEHDFVHFFPERFRDAFRLELEAFVQAVSAGDPPPVTISDGERALRIAVAARQSAQTGQAVSIADL